MITHPKIAPSEAARKLIAKFGPHVQTFHAAKQCAVICATEMTDIFSIFDGPQGSTYCNPGKYYWKQVKKEIEKL